MALFAVVFVAIFAPVWTDAAALAALLVLAASAVCAIVVFSTVVTPAAFL